MLSTFTFYLFALITVCSGVVVVFANRLIHAVPSVRDCQNRIHTGKAHGPIHSLAGAAHWTLISSRMACVDIKKFPR